MRGFREQPARVLANRTLEAAGEVFQWERAGSAQRFHRPEAEPSMAPDLGRPCQDLLGLQGYCLMKGHAVGCVFRYAQAPPQAQHR